jgi:TrmH family RNA methyltransferase
MISKANTQLVKGLQDKKQRQKYGHFLVEGEKSIAELLKSKFKVRKVFALESWIRKNNSISSDIQVYSVDEKELRQISSHAAPQEALAIADIPAERPLDLSSGFTLALDEIQDPGNLGTIIRIADWYGIRQIICSKGCTDVYSPKCINSTMGSFLRVNVVYGDIVSLAEQSGQKLIVSTFDGDNIHKTNLPEKGILVIGNEGHGIQQRIIDKAAYKLTIPRFGSAESLNAAVSTAILLDNLIR